MGLVSDLIDRLGGRKAVSDATGIPYTTIQGWEVSDFVPEWRRPVLLDFAVKTDKPLSTDDFPAKRRAAA